MLLHGRIVQTQTNGGYLHLTYSDNSLKVEGAAISQHQQRVIRERRAVE